MGTLSIICK